MTSDVDVLSDDSCMTYIWGCIVCKLYFVSVMLGVATAW